MKRRRGERPRAAEGQQRASCIVSGDEARPHVDQDKAVASTMHALAHCVSITCEGCAQLAHVAPQVVHIKSSACALSVRRDRSSQMALHHCSSGGSNTGR